MIRAFAAQLNAGLTHELLHGNEPRGDASMAALASLLQGLWQYYSQVGELTYTFSRWCRSTLQIPFVCCMLSLGFAQFNRSATVSLPLCAPVSSIAGCTRGTHVFCPRLLVSGDLCLR